MPDPEVTVLILAGGESRRFGSDKARAQVPGRTGSLLADAVRLGLTVAAQTIVVGPERPGIDIGKAILVGEDVPFQGPLAGARTGLKAVGHPLVILMAVDQPFVSADLLRQLIARCRVANTPVCFRVGEDIATFPCAAPSRSLNRQVRESWGRGERSLLAVLQECGLITLPASSGVGQELRDVDVPTDLRNSNYVTDG